MNAMSLKILLIVYGLGLLFSVINISFAQSSTDCVESIEDTDGDNILNVWEEKGIDVNDDQTVDLNLSGVSNPLHKDIFLELDYMEHHKPNQTAMNQVINTFANAPVCNPDGQEGIDLHIIVDDVITHDGNTLIDCSESKNMTSDSQTNITNDDWSEIQDIRDVNFGLKSDRDNPNFENIIAAKDLIYYYGVFIHQINNSPDSGCAHDTERLFVVSLGNESWWQLEDVIGKDIANNDTKSDTKFQARSLMHELGHTLGLVHGGDRSLNDLNYKPNYLSVMNYLYLFPDTRMEDVSFLDYSRCALPDINEVLTDPNKGIDIGDCVGQINKNMIWVGYHEYNNETAACMPDQMVQFNTPVNWSANKIPGSIFTDINCDDRERDLLKGFNDWENLIYLRN
jgi:hypothetical protein